MAFGAITNMTIDAVVATCINVWISLAFVFLFLALQRKLADTFKTMNMRKRSYEMLENMQSFIRSEHNARVSKRKFSPANANNYFSHPFV